MSDALRMCTRREFARTALVGGALAAQASIGAREQAPSTPLYRGVKLGLITGSLNPLPQPPGIDPVDVMIGMCLEVGAAMWKLPTSRSRGMVVRHLLCGAGVSVSRLTRSRLNTLSHGRRNGNGAWRSRWTATSR